jgi:hypothetical protein
VDWVKLSSRYYLDVAIASLPDADTEVMFTRGLAYAGDQESHGFIPAGILPALCRRRRYEACADALVAASLWLPSRGGYQIARWEEWQLELEAIARRRSADRERKRQERARQKEEEQQVSGMSRDMSAGQSAPKREESKNSSAKAEEDHVRGDVQRLCTHLADRIEANGSQRPGVTSRWHDAARLLLDRDGRAEHQVHAAIDWCQDSEFWRSNILSMPKLREKYDQLRLQATRPANGRQAETDQQFARQMERARARENNEPQRHGSADPVRPRMLPAAGHG